MTPNNRIRCADCRTGDHCGDCWCCCPAAHPVREAITDAAGMVLAVLMLCSLALLVSG